MLWCLIGLHQSLKTPIASLFLLTPNGSHFKKNLKTYKFTNLQYIESKQQQQYE